VVLNYLGFLNWFGLLLFRVGASSSQGYKGIVINEVLERASVWGTKYSCWAVLKKCAVQVKRQGMKVNC